MLDTLSEMHDELSKLQEAVLINALIEQSVDTDLEWNNMDVFSMVKSKLSLDMKSSLSNIMGMMEKLHQCGRDEKRSKSIQDTALAVVVCPSFAKRMRVCRLPTAQPTALVHARAVAGGGIDTPPRAGQDTRRCLSRKGRSCHRSAGGAT